MWKAKASVVGPTIALVLALTLSGAAADKVKLDVALGKPVLLAGREETTHLKVSLTGFVLESEKERAPVNVAIVLDKSGSMRGEKLAQAKEAARQAVERLGSRDTVAIVAYDHTVNVLLPAARATDKPAIAAAIDRIAAGGNTALFAGVSKGAEELRKFLDKNRANRIILLSDGLANVGPSSPAELGSLGASLIKENISVTTIGLGLGYNEDLMTELARRSDGNHAFVAEPADLPKIFSHEFGDVLSVVAQEVVVRIHCADGIRPLRLLGREGIIDGQTVTTTLNQLYSSQEKYVLLEVQVPPSEEGAVRDVASVSLSYLNMETGKTDQLTSSLAVRFAASQELVDKNANGEVQEAAVAQIATFNNALATRLRDEGKIEQARQLLLENAEFLGRNAAALESEQLRTLQKAQKDDADNLDAENWGEQRKKMRDRQYQMESQRAW
ncbi:MAG: vWA domain-containing protein [Candidatus Brocadiia bacterium]